MKLKAGFAFLALGQVLAAGPPQWPQFRGPNGSGVAEDARPPIDPGAKDNSHWKATLPLGRASLWVWNEWVFLRTDNHHSALASP